jgi:DNA-directed RNA polymerase subunit alpha
LQQLTLPRIRAAKLQGTFGQYDIEPLDAGYGTTLGNALRRVLLSSLPGAAVTSIRIEGVQHEFTAISGVLEDVTEIVLNVKLLRLRYKDDVPVTLSLAVRGARAVTAADIVAPSSVEIVNRDLHLATLDNAQSELVMELVVDTGKGYVSAETKQGQPIGVIPVDAIYSPVQKANFTVERTRIGQDTSYDKVVVEIWTDGTISPDEALRQSAEILIRHFTQIASYQGEAGEPEEPEPTSTVPIPPQVYDRPLESLGLSVRAFNCLRRANIYKVGQILEMEEKDLTALKNFGVKSLCELGERLLAHNLLPVPDSVVA